MSSTRDTQERAEIEATEYNIHIPVLLTEVLSFVRDDVPNYVVVDMTLGRAGHSSSILQKLKNNCYLYAFDRDLTAIDFSQKKLSKYGDNFKIFHSPFSKAVEILKNNGLKGADFILFDIGVSSPQFDDPSRGFSYRFDGPLDMRMDETQSLTAAKVVNEYSEGDLKRILYEYGGEDFAGPIARAIVKRREEKPITRTLELVDVIKSALPERVLRKKGHPAKQTFMALRYEVNDERAELEKALKDSIQFLNHGGRLAVITFNSDEDRVVKDIFKEYGPKSIISRFLPPSPDEKSEYHALTRKPILPDEYERAVNPRSESAKLRVLERE